jgi:NADPH2:quinone reductase
VNPHDPFLGVAPLCLMHQRYLAHLWMRTVKAAVCTAYGPPEHLELQELPDPTPGLGQLLVAVKAAAVTFPDTLMLENRYQFSAPTPFIPGGAIAGQVAAVGEGVDGWSVGDPVVGSSGIVGGFAELALVPATTSQRLPDSVEFAAVAGLNYAYGTTYYALKHRGHLQPGETMLVTGAAGSVGLSAIELGKLMGARVIAAASTDAKLDLCRSRGADETINYSTENLKERCKELTDGRGVDVVYDCVGGDHAEQAVRAMGWEGRFLVIGFAAGIPSVPLNLTLLKGCSIVGVFYGAMTTRQPDLDASISAELIDLVATGRLDPYVAARYPLDRAGEALRAMMNGTIAGKLVITP